jgi:glyoxylase-like metal-dependent hydrolase (beta-lactamase superfamily II)
VRVSIVLAPNPSPYTGPGTNTYLIEDSGEVAVLDPGPVIQSHLAEIIATIGELTPVAVIATHTHPDHAPLANPLASALDVPVIGHGPGPEFAPDRAIGDGGTIAIGGAELIAVHTPGHTPDHLCFVLGDRLFTGDHIMGGSTVIIEDAAAYMDSLYRVQALAVTRIEPGHGPVMDDAAAVIEGYIDHRKMRERQLIAAVAAGAHTVEDLVAVVYGDVPAAIIPAAMHQVGVQLAKLSKEGAVLLLPGGAGTETRVELTREP